MFQIIFGKMLGVLPIYGTLDPFIDRPPFITGMVVVDSLITGNLPAFFNSLEHMILPWLTIGLLLSATISRIARANMIEALGEDYVVGARAKGTPESVVTYKHALRNALLPVVTVIGLQFALLLGGALLTEYVYSLNGMGSLLISAIYDRDFPLTQGIVVVFSLLVALVSLSIDIVYAFLDPRIKY
jgi:peptide/nickel transport system permease protein